MPTFEQLNARQGHLYKAGKEDTPEYWSIIEQMIPMWPASMGQPPLVPAKYQSIKSLRKIKSG